MFADYSKDLLRSGIIELKAGNQEMARRYLDRAVYMSSDHDVMAEAWYWLSQITDNAIDKRSALENCLVNDLNHARAPRALAILDGKLRPSEIINPEALPPAPLGWQKVDASLEARSRAYASLKREVPSQVRPARLLSTSSANLAIEDFHLDLLPVWMTEIATECGRSLVLIKGQNGTVQGEGFGRSNKANGGLLEWLADLVGE